MATADATIVGAKTGCPMSLLEVSDTVIEIDADLVSPSFVTDRLGGVDDPGLTVAIREHGQLVPILVRLHPEEAGRYQVAYGHRRLKAALTLGRPVRAIVRPMTDVELVVAQGQENSARTDLSFIERALYAANLEVRGFSRETIMASLGVDKAGLSRLISTATKVPKDIIDGIGSAPKAGRTRWAKLVEHLVSPKAVDEARALICTPEFQGRTSDAKFVFLLQHLADPAESSPARMAFVIEGRNIGTVTRGATSTTIRIDEDQQGDYADFLSENFIELYERWRASRHA